MFDLYKVRESAGSTARRHSSTAARLVVSDVSRSDACQSSPSLSDNLRSFVRKLCCPEAGRSNLPIRNSRRGPQVYEEFFGLHQRPFTLVPNADDFVEIPPMQDALDSLVHCLTQSRGIAVLTSAPGLGKTMLCRRLIKSLEQESRSIYLSAAGMETRISLLQGILFELNMGYIGLSDQEARLKLFDAARTARANQKRLLLIIDEAQGLTSRLFEEIRALTDYAPEGEFLIQAVLCGSFELEENLADPALSAFNQRIGLQLCLTPLSLNDSAFFLSERFKASGASDLLSILDEEALDLICRASDGNLHCLSQLADHACLTAFANGERPVNRELVRETLENLKELPLRWSDVPGEISRDQSSVDDFYVPAQISGNSSAEESRPPYYMSPLDQETDEFLIPEFLRTPATTEEPVADERKMSDSVSSTSEEGATGHEVTGHEVTGPAPADFAVFEVGAGLDTETGFESASAGLCLCDAPSPEQPTLVEEQSARQPSTSQAIPAPQSSQVCPGCEELSQIESPPPESLQVWPQPINHAGIFTPTRLSNMIESPVLDRYTFLDRIFELPEERWTAADLERLQTLPAETASRMIDSREFDDLDQPPDDESVLPLPVQSHSASAREEAPENAILEMIQQIRQDLQHHAAAGKPSHSAPAHPVETIPISPALQVTGISAPIETDAPSADSVSGVEGDPHRQFEQLFTRLRLRRKRLESERCQS